MESNTVSRRLGELVRGDVVRVEGRSRVVARVGVNPNATVDVVFEGGGSLWGYSNRVVKVAGEVSCAQAS